MNLDPILTGACELEAFCKAHAWHFCFIGGLAVQRWGEPRFTADADLTIEGVLARQWNKLDLALFRSEVGPLLDLREEPGILARFEGLHARMQARLG